MVGCVFRLHICTATKNAPGIASRLQKLSRCDRLGWPAVLPTPHPHPTPKKQNKKKLCTLVSATVSLYKMQKLSLANFRG